MDGWPQFSDAVVDYYFAKKLAYDFIKRAQAPLCLVIKEPLDDKQELVACNDSREALQVRYSIRDAESGEIVATGEAIAAADSVTPLAEIPFDASRQRFYIIEWRSSIGDGKSHYLAGQPPFGLETYRRWLSQLENA
jgi:beta-mannosidase